MTRRHVLAIGIWLLATLTGTAQMPDLSVVGPKIGAAAEEFAAVDQFGRRQALQTLAGRDGLMLVFFRSADW